MAAAGAVAMPACLSARPAGPSILAFGDSLTAGFGLPPEEGLVPVLSDWLARRGTPARLTNAGLSGETTYGGRVRINWALRGGADAVMVELGGNDMLLGWTAARAEANLDAILSKATARGRPVLLIGISAPAGAREWRRAWAGLWPRLARRHGTLLLPDLYAPLAAIARDDRAPLLQRDGIHPSSQGIRLIVDHLGPKVQDLVAATRAAQAPG
tara:strand:- start:7516 stop:8154 length:639 start_codon:yes stop_codon:yes gene_type:complete